MFILCKKNRIKFLVVLIFLINIGFATTEEVCPNSPAILKHILEQNPKLNFYQTFSMSCQTEIQNHYIKGEKEWIEIIPLLSNYISLVPAMNESIFINPLNTLKIINQYNFLSEEIGLICQYSSYDVTKSERDRQVTNINNSIRKLTDLQNLSSSLNNLRQRCLHYLERQKSRTLFHNTCPRTPEGMADLIKEDNGASLALESDECINPIFNATRMGDPKWLALAPVLLNIPRNNFITTLIEEFQSTLIYAIPRNPEATFNIIAKYFPDKVDEVCYSETILENYEDGNIDEYTESQVMDIPGAISGLKALQLKDKKTIQIRDRCIDRLEYTLKTAQHISMNGGPE
jgi:hypothetical protein